MNDAPLALSDGCVTLGGREVLHGVTFTLQPAEFVTLLGANGSGKSTLVKTLLGLLPLSHGQLRLFGTPLRAFREWPRLGYVPQRTSSETGVPATVREVVMSGRTPRLSRWRGLRPVDRAAVDDALGAVGLAHRAADPVATLSGGQQQRVLIARALAVEPEALVLDEPTAGVDTDSQDAFSSTLALLKDKGVAVLLVSHHVGALARLVDRVVVMAEGQTSYDGPVPPAGMPDDDHHHPGTAALRHWGLT
jgi:zinc transport system ATP-binding protein